MECEKCKGSRIKDEQYYVDIIESLANVTNRRSFVINIILSIALILTVILLVLSENKRIELEREFETVEEYYAEIEQDADGGGSNYVVGGDFLGEAKSKSNEEDAQNP